MEANRRQLELRTVDLESLLPASHRARSVWAVVERLELSEFYAGIGSRGKMRSEEADPQKVLRWALGRAGIVEGYDHVCRRCKAAKREPNTWRHSDSAKRTCPTCGMGLWPRAIPRPMRFHDVRHSTATMLLRAGVDIHRVQRLLRHTDVRVTAGVYGHLMVDDLRDAVAALPPVLPESTIPALPPPTAEITARIASQRVMTVREAAQALGVSTATVYKMVETGELPHFRVSNAIRFRVEDLPGADAQANGP